MNSLRRLVAALGIVAGVAFLMPVTAQATPALVEDTAVSVTASPATTAVEPCEAGWVCLYASTGFVNMAFRTQRQHWCWNLEVYGLVNHVFSYDNNLPVYGHFFNAGKTMVWSIRNGGSSSNSTSYSGEFYFCTGSARP